MTLAIIGFILVMAAFVGLVRPLVDSWAEAIQNVAALAGIILTMGGGIWLIIYGMGWHP